MLKRYKVDDNLKVEIISNLNKLDINSCFIKEIKCKINELNVSELHNENMLLEKSNNSNCLINNNSDIHESYLNVINMN